MTAAPTLREVAKAAGVHQATVSRALRHQPGVSRKMGDAIRALATKMGYVPDPMLSALAAYRTTRRPAAFHSVIAWLNPSTIRADWKRYRTFREFFDSAASRARALGFQLEEVVLPAAGAGAARVTSMLRARNVSGVIVGPAPVLGVGLETIDWRLFSGVRIGLSLERPQLHSVAPHHSQGMFTIMREVAARGYRRPGLVISTHLDERVQWRWSAAFLRAQLWLPAARNRIPPLFFVGEQVQAAGLVSWARKYRPDVLLAVGNEVSLPLLRRQCGWRVPEDIGLTVLTQPDEDRPVTGILENNTETGTRAVDFVADMMTRQERGIPEYPQVLRITNRWIENGTLRPRPKQPE
ncbi:LacI family transcriptional regulator [Opitutaceae bacterium TAV5]|nr:LacI family transcriptional regulator [Opitutaceae bacterium TAV5]